MKILAAVKSHINQLMIPHECGCDQERIISGHVCRSSTGNEHVQDFPLCISR